MKTHTVKEEIVADGTRNNYLLYAEVDPQPEDFNEIIQENGSRVFWLTHRGTKEKFYTIHHAMSIGDTVYQGEEWDYYPDGEPSLNKDLILKKNWPVNSGEHWQSLETMPIKLADKTFKVVGIEVTSRLNEVEGIDLKPQDFQHIKWFWKYELEAI